MPRHRTFPATAAVLLALCLLPPGPLSAQADPQPGTVPGRLGLPPVVLELAFGGGVIGAQTRAVDNGLGGVFGMTYHRMPLVVMARATALSAFNIICFGSCVFDPASMVEASLMAGYAVSNPWLGASLAVGPGWTRAEFPRELGDEEVGGVGVSFAAQAFYITAAGGGIGLHGFAHAGRDTYHLGISLAARIRP